MNTQELKDEELIKIFIKQSPPKDIGSVDDGFWDWIDILFEFNARFNVVVCNDLFNTNIYLAFCIHLEPENLKDHNSSVKRYIRAIECEVVEEETPIIEIENIDQEEMVYKTDLDSFDLLRSNIYSNKRSVKLVTYYETLEDAVREISDECFESRSFDVYFDGGRNFSREGCDKSFIDEKLRADIQERVREMILEEKDSLKIDFTYNFENGI